MKIVYFIDHLRPDGTQHVLVDLVCGLAERGHSQAVVCLNNSWDEQVTSHLRSAGCELRVVGKLPLASGVGWISVLKWLRREQFEAAVTLLFASDVVGRILAHRAGIPQVASYIQARNTNYAAWQRFLVRQTMQYADHIVLCSQSIRKFAVQGEGASPDKICVIPHGVRFHPQPATVSKNGVRAEYGLQPGDRLMGSLGRLAHQKGYDVLLQALADLADPSLHLIIAGEGDQREELQSLADRLGIDQRVHFAGYRRDTAKILESLDLYVQPSRYEGMSLAVLEAMATGLPVVASAVDGNCELIQEGASGWLVPPGDSRLLAGAIRSALADPLERRQRGQAARDIAREQFSLDAMVDAWEALLTGRVAA